MKRRQQVTDRPPIPDELGPFHAADWLTTAERTAKPVDDGVAVGVKAYRRWQRARQAWAEQNGYSAHEMYRAAHPEL